MALRKERVLDRATQGKAFDSLRCPIRRNFLATHPPHFLRVTLEECIEEPPAKLIADPFFKVTGIAHRKETRLEPGKDTKDGAKNPKFDQRFEWFERIGEKFSSVENTGRPWPVQHIVRQDLAPKIFHRLAL